MNKVQLARGLGRQFGFSRRESRAIVERLVGALAQALVLGRRIELRGLGTLGTKTRRPSVGRVVKTGAPVPVPGMRRVFFRPGRSFKSLAISATR